MDGSERRAPRLMLVTDRRRAKRPLPELVAAAVAGGVDAVQLREPDLGPGERLELAGELQAVVGGRAALLVNGDAATAAALGLGLHLPE
ncbi:MAG: thiamine phosphate synthase, partial [Chloroflexota bacterium]|nr:thiamine phosphate synthase [Chloroflexota bacterium]